uniref:Uncharacterized protein n=1 Tax=Anopheles christyi TaxID=43041 RepID=A0A182KGC6_9DIPT
MVDGKGRPVLASIADKHTDNPAFVENMIQLEVDGVDDVTAYYRILRQNSLQLLKVFLSIKKHDEAKLFESLANALIKLRVKNFPLSFELTIYVQWKLADYGFRHLTGDYKPPIGQETPPDEWKKHISVISDCWSFIVEKYDTEEYMDIDDALLQRLTVIHNHLYFLQYKPFLKHLPMQEIIFCLATFVTIYQHPSDFVYFRLIVNKCLMMEFVRVITRQLKCIKENLEIIEEELKAIEKKHYQLL